MIKNLYNSIKRGFQHFKNFTQNGFGKSLLNIAGHIPVLKEVVGIAKGVGDLLESPWNKVGGIPKSINIGKDIYKNIQSLRGKKVEDPFPPLNPVE